MIMLTVNPNIVYTREKQWTSARLSGVGIICHSGEASVTVPLEADQRHDDAGLDPSAVMDLRLFKSSFSDKNEFSWATPQPFWGFPFHETCWILLAILHKPQEFEAHALHGLFRSLPHVSVGLLSFGHNYGGIMKYLPKPEEHIPGEEYEIYRRYGRRRYYPQDPKRDPMEYSDPLNIPSLQEIFQQNLKGQGEFHEKNNADEPTMTNDTPLRVSNPTDCFQIFPTEISDCILMLLPSKDVLNVKLASATFAALPLTKTFWASRFQRGFEFHCVFESHGLQTKDYDWESIYFGVRSLQDNYNFKNRRRIWKLLLLVEELHGRLISAELHGTASNSFFEPDAPEDKRSWNLASGVLNEPEIDFSDGCRSLFTRTVDITFKVTGVFVTFARFNGMKYVSGLQFQQHDGVSSSLGYVVLNEEIEMDVDGSLLSKDGCGISGFYLAINSRGVRAISLISSSGKVSKWFGKHDGIPKTRLFLNHGDVISLKAGFDVSCFYSSS